MLENACLLLEILKENGYEGYIVGGYVRDYLLNKESFDIDITTNATPKELREIFKDSKISKDEYGSVVITIKNNKFEVTTYRKEIKYQDNRKPIEFEYIDTLEEDLKRRDFTINSICMDKDKNIIDIFNAKSDIDKKIINTIGDANKKFNEDVLRILRAIRFATVLNFKLSEEVKIAILENKYLLKNLSYNRKKEELDKIFASNNAGYGIKLLKELDLLKVLDIRNLSSVTSFNNIIGIWAMIDEGYYPFNKVEKEQIKMIKEELKLDLLDPFTLYKYGLYISMITGELKGIDKKEIISNYDLLPIKSKKDIVINGKDIIDILNIEPSKMVSDIHTDIEYEILFDKLNNDYESIKNYILDNYKN